MSGFKLLCFMTSFSAMAANPIVLKGSSPSGETVIAISSSDPNIEKYITFNFPTPDTTEDNTNPGPNDILHKTFSTALAGTNTSSGRNFGSFNPFFLPFFNFPLNFESFRPDWVRQVESYDPMGNGEFKTVTTVNDNGHVYGKVETVTFDNAKSSQ